MNVKELFANEELMNSIVEDLDDIPEDTEVTYDVWAICYDAEGTCIDTYLVKEFINYDNPDAAIKFAKDYTFDQFDAAYQKPPKKTATISLEVETVIDDPEGDGTMNIGTVYQKDLWVSAESNSEDIIDPTVELGPDDYEITEEGELKISCKLLKDFNKNDYINVKFAGEDNPWPIPYRIVSKVVYADGDYYHCDILF